MERLLIRGVKELQETKDDLRKIRSFPDRALRRKFLSLVKLFQDLGNAYFPTEFFFLDDVEHLVKQNPGRYQQLAINLTTMGALKLQARALLTRLYNYKDIFHIYVDEIARREKRKDTQWLSYNEIVEVLDQKDIFTNTRKTSDWILAKRLDWKLDNEKHAQRVILEFQKYFFTTTSFAEVKGVVANPGKCVGRAKVLRTVFSNAVANEIRKVKAGDILIANTTGPEVMAACHKAGAIVTDEGGLTSHAAIVSRELGIPCIVGMKVATRVFKDGDFIEVDANNGIVKKLSTNQRL